MSFVKFVLQFVFGSMLATIWTVPVLAQSKTLAERQLESTLRQAGAVPYTGGGFGGLSDREIGRRSKITFPFKCFKHNIHTS